MFADGISASCTNCRGSGNDAAQCRGMFITGNGNCLVFAAF